MFLKILRILINSSTNNPLLSVVCGYNCKVYVSNIKCDFFLFYHIYILASFLQCSVTIADPALTLSSTEEYLMK